MNKSKQIDFTHLEHIVLIGSGDLLVNSAKILNNAGYSVSVVLAPRHANEALISQNMSISNYLNKLNIPFQCIKDINQLETNTLRQLSGDHSAALCFGPAWIFNKNVINAFSYGMYNVNAIPIPHYLGGAHYTWQLLNQNYEGGCFLQVITEQIDQGDILAQRQFTINKAATSPHDFFIENIKESTIFIKEWVNNLKNSASFSLSSYHDLNLQRIYLPRLRTDKQGYINWQWPVDDILSFCQGFSLPYQGAATFIQQTEIRLHHIEKVKLNHAPMHPFASGLIIRKLDQHIIVAAIGGFLKISHLPADACEKLKEGMRLHTPAHILEQALNYQVTLTADGFKEE